MPGSESKQTTADIAKMSLRSNKLSTQTRSNSPHGMNTMRTKTNLPSSPLSNSGPQLDSLNARFDKLTSLVTTRFDDISEKLNNLEANFYSLSTDVQGMNGRISLLEENYAAKEAIINEILAKQSLIEERIHLLDATRHEINEMRTHVSKLEENAVASDIVIRGIPADANENLITTFTTLCSTINCPNIKVNNIFRLKQHNKNSDLTTDAGVIVKLNSITDKSSILRAAAEFRKQNKTTLILQHAGIDSNSPIYINECLTKKKKHLLNVAIQLKRNRHLWAVYTMRGRVYIKKRQGDTSIEITNIDTLNELSSNNNTQQQFFHYST